MSDKRKRDRRSDDSESADESSRSTGEVSAEKGADQSSKKKTDWSDPNVPVGNAPAMPVWPLAVFGIAWFGWLVFLFVMALTPSAGPAV